MLFALAIAALLVPCSALAPLLRASFDLHPRGSLGSHQSLYNKRMLLTSSVSLKWLIIADAPENKYINMDQTTTLETPLNIGDIELAIQEQASAYPETAFLVISNAEWMGLSSFESIFASFPVNTLVQPQPLNIPELTILPTSTQTQLNEMIGYSNDASVILFQLSGLDHNQKQSLIAILPNLFPNYLPVFTTDRVGNTHSTSGSVLEKRQLKTNTSSTNCFPDLTTCKTNSNNCTSNGSCQLIGSCYKCKCKQTGKTHYAGDKCQFQDISAMYQILLWSTIALVLILVFAVSMLSSIGADEGGSTFIPGRMKTE